MKVCAGASKAVVTARHKEFAKYCHVNGDASNGFKNSSRRIDRDFRRADADTVKFRRKVQYDGLKR